MRLFHVLPILSLFFGARASSLGSREPAAHPLDARDLLDVCALVNTDVQGIGVIGRFNVPISSALHIDFDR